MLHSFDINNNNNTNTGGTNEFFFLNSVLGETRRDTNHKSLCYLFYIEPTPRTAHVAVPKISTHLCWSWPKLVCFDQIRKTQPCAWKVEPQLVVFLKSSKFQDHLLWVRRQPPAQFTPMTVQPHFLSADLLCQLLSVISFLRGHRSAPSDYETWTKKQKSSKPNQTK